MSARRIRKLRKALAAAEMRLGTAAWRRLKRDRTKRPVRIRAEEALEAAGRAARGAVMARVRRETARRVVRSS